MKRILGVLWDLKLRLQFTGWLQFVPPLLLAVVALLVAAAGSSLGLSPAMAVWPFLGVAAAVIANFCFEVTTLRLGVRPREPLPASLASLDTFELMRARHSCRSFQNRDLLPEHRAELLACAERHTRPSRLIGTRAVRLEFVAAPLTVWPVLGAREFFVAVAPKDYDRVAIVDLGRALQKLVLEATRMGLGTCWIGPGAEPSSLAAHLGSRFDPARDHVVCVCAVGYRSWIQPLTIRGMAILQHRRLPLASLFFRDPSLARPLDTREPPFDRFGRCFEVCQWSPSSYNEQPVRCVGVVDGHGHLERFDFYSATTSRYYASIALGIWCANWETGCDALGIPGRLQRLDVPTTDAAPVYGVSWVPGP